MSTSRMLATIAATTVVTTIAMMSVVITAVALVIIMMIMIVAIATIITLRHAPLAALTTAPLVRAPLAALAAAPLVAAPLVTSAASPPGVTTAVITASASEQLVATTVDTIASASQSVVPRGAAARPVNEASAWEFPPSSAARFTLDKASDAQSMLAWAADRTFKRLGDGDYVVVIKKLERSSLTDPHYGQRTEEELNLIRAAQEDSALDRRQERARALTLTRALPAARPPTWPLPNPVCANCMITGHDLRHCILATEEPGDLYGCPFCNSLASHLPEECPEYIPQAHLTWEYFVKFRAGKCQIRTRSEELTLGYLVRERLRTHPDEAPLPLYPVSRKFAKDQMRERPNLFETHDYKQEPNNLPADPKTATRQAILDDPFLLRPYQTAQEIRQYFAGRRATEFRNDR
ncbi:hypothetical protein QBC42DRAFT_282197 [Cladorrhinum samala]|uniref:Uncharacterized protein n=1 Tax=Cladorrhinum samala TaxID=585594 RepID=A0AAV9I7C3_9PEZI|nr:hypothetical protein QBC42DRAFT_282197 [Cladorrhinum samala]